MESMYLSEMLRHSTPFVVAAKYAITEYLPAFRVAPRVPQNKDFDVTLLEGGKSVGGLVAGWLTPGGRPVEAGVHGFWCVRPSVRKNTSEVGCMPADRRKKRCALPTTLHIGTVLRRYVDGLTFAPRTPALHIG